MKNSFNPHYLIIIVILQISFAATFGQTAAFTYSKRSVCAPTLVEFTNNSTAGSGITYKWDFGLGAIVTTMSNSKREQLYTNPGQYKVTLTVMNGANTDSTSAIITIAKRPEAHFTTSTTGGCKPLDVEFTSTSTEGDTAILTTSWDFRNGDYGSGSIVNYTYNFTGKYGVVLRVTDKNGCSALIESDSLITVINKPVIAFTATDTFACTPPLNTTFQNLSGVSSSLTYQWNFGNGTTSTALSSSTVYNLTGSYNVTLKATDQYGCTDSLVRESYINIGNPPGGILIYDINNNLVNSNSLCSGTYRFAFTVTNMPDYTWFIQDNDSLVTFTGMSFIVYQVKDTGTIAIDLLYGKNNVCVNNVHKTFEKNHIKAAFAADKSSFCSVPQKINFQNTSENSSGFSWYFNNKLFSSSNDTSYTITQNDITQKTYSELYSHEIDSVKLPVKLVVVNSEGCMDSVTQQMILAMPTAWFMPDKISGCVPLQVTFSDSSKSVFAIDKYVYKIGTDSVTTTDKTLVTYTFTAPGEYYVSEIVRSGACSDTSHIVKITAGDKLTPDFTVTPAEVCNGGEIHITGSSNNNSAVNNWHFSSPGIFGYSFTSLPDTFITVYTDTTGFKNIILEVDYNGCFSEVTKNSAFRIIGPAGHFTESFRCDTPLVYHFNSGINPATSFSWMVNSSVVGNNNDSIRYVFPVRGDYNVTLEATDNISGCMLTRTKIVKVRQVKADFTINDTIFCVGDSVKLNAATSLDYINTCYNEGFLWDFGDFSRPERTYLTFASHTYQKRDTNNILLVVKAENGCIDSMIRSVYIRMPVGEYTLDKSSGCIPSFNVNFTNTSADSTIVGSYWIFGDGSNFVQNQVNVSHTFTSKIQTTYYPTLVVYDGYQCYGTYSLPVSFAAINSDFQANDNAICLGQNVTFFPVEPELDSLTWNFGDGISSKVTSNHTYNNPGKYNVSLIASKGGCTSTTLMQNYISVENGNANFTISDSVANCYPHTVNFSHNNLIGSPAVYRLWTMGTQELTGKNDDEVSYVFNRPGIYKAMLDVRTLNGCEASSSKNIDITGPNAILKFDPQKICYNDIVNFTIDSIQNVNSWQLLFGDGTSSTSNPVSHRYTARGKIVPALLLNGVNCIVTNTYDTLSISSVEADFSIAGNGTAVCEGSNASFTNQSLFSDHWRWEINDVFLAGNKDLFNVLLPETGANNVKLIAYDKDNCTDTVIKIFNLVPKPVFFITGDTILCKDQDSVVLSVNTSAGSNIQWSPATGLSNPNSFIVFAQPSENTTYTALVTDANGCSASQQKTVVVNPVPDFTRIPMADTTIQIGQSLQLLILTDMSDVNYVWTPGYNISCQICNNPTVSPVNSVVYTVDVSGTCIGFSENFTVNVVADFYMEAPTAFTPNGDRNNDVFKFEQRNIGNIDLKIFNRWGKIVFSTADVNEGWDGRVNGQMQNIDTYTYFVKAETIYGYKFEKKGSFLLLK